MAISKLACRLVSTWATWKDKTFEPEPVGWPVQAKRRRRSALFLQRGHHGIHGFVKQNEDKKARTGCTPSVLVRVTLMSTS